MTIQKSSKGISPVLTVLLLIAVSVASALITHIWLVTYMNNTITKVGHVIWIPSVYVTEDNGATAITIYVQNIRDGTVQLTEVYVNGARVSEDDVTMSDDGFIEEGETCTINTINQSIENYGEVRIKITCIDGVSTEGMF